MPRVIAIPVTPLPLGGGAPLAPLQNGPPSQPPVRAEPVIDLRAFYSLTVPERDFVRNNLKKRERAKLAQLLVQSDSRKRNRGGGLQAPPLRIQVMQSALSERVRAQIFEDLRGNSCEKYIRWVKRALQLPLGTLHPGRFEAKTPIYERLQVARTAMNERITGHEAAKTEVLKLLVQDGLPDTVRCGYSLGLEGIPGTGKTHFVRTALAEALGRPLVSIPLGGAADLSYLMGSLFTYEGSKEGRLASSFIEAGCINPIIHFDEVDKLSQSERGQELSAVLIHLIDPSANTALRDRYFHDIDLDFSKCTFVFSYNNPQKVNPILLDRIKRVTMPAPSTEERATIVRDHMVPRTLARLGNVSLTLSEPAIAFLLARASGGMRGVEKEVDHVLGDAQLALAEDVLDAKGHVGVDFVEASLTRLAQGDAVTSPPPAGMYT